ncbi:MAG: transglutaminase family protein [Oscillospiraceae bacterium]|nr:transglutaminase family protein [Oscillospiraceae bacterium]
MSRRLDFFYDILLEFDQPVRGHDFVLRCLPPSFPGQDILDASLALDPYAHFALQRDGFGNLMQLGRIEEPHDHFRYTVRGTARVELALRQPESALPIFRFPSAYTGVSRSMEELLAGLSLPDDPEDRAWALSNAVQEHMAYTPGVTGVDTTAAQAFEAGQGVCQDFAHIWLALARASGLTARYVNGLTQGEGASHAWCEVWLDGLWTGIDPTRGRWTDDSYIRFGVGRDFGDCPIERGVFLGRIGQRQTVYMKVSQQ